MFVLILTLKMHFIWELVFINTSTLVPEQTHAFFLPEPHFFPFVLKHSTGNVTAYGHLLPLPHSDSQSSLHFMITPLSQHEHQYLVGSQFIINRFTLRAVGLQRWSQCILLNISTDIFSTSSLLHTCYHIHNRAGGINPADFPECIREEIRGDLYPLFCFQMPLCF